VQKINNSFPNDLHNSATLNANLMTHGSDGEAYPNGNPPYQYDNLDIGMVHNGR